MFAVGSVNGSDLVCACRKTCGAMLTGHGVGAESWTTVTNKTVTHCRPGRLLHCNLHRLPTPMSSTCNKMDAAHCLPLNVELALATAMFKTASNRPILSLGQFQSSTGYHWVTNNTHCSCPCLQCTPLQTLESLCALAVPQYWAAFSTHITKNLDTCQAAASALSPAATVIAFRQLAGLCHIVLACQGVCGRG
jgi:hypothetical protein